MHSCERGLDSSVGTTIDNQSMYNITCVKTQRKQTRPSAVLQIWPFRYIYDIEYKVPKILLPPETFCNRACSWSSSAISSMKDFSSWSAQQLRALSIVRRAEKSNCSSMQPLTFSSFNFRFHLRTDEKTAKDSLQRKNYSFTPNKLPVHALQKSKLKNVQ